MPKQYTCKRNRNGGKISFDQTVLTQDNPRNNKYLNDKIGKQTSDENEDQISVVKDTKVEKSECAFNVNIESPVKKQHKMKRDKLRKQNCQDESSTCASEEMTMLHTQQADKRKDRKRNKLSTDKDSNSIENDCSYDVNLMQTSNEEIQENSGVKKIKKKNKLRIVEASIGQVEGKREEKKRKIEEQSNQNVDVTATNVSGEVAINSKEKESKRALKKKRYEQLLQKKHAQREQAVQQKSLNYLSMWKHNRTDWKFEKLKQIWLLQNMFDSVKVPQKTFDIAVEYFNKSEGKVRVNLLNEATKIIECESNLAEDGDKYERAKCIVQNLEE